MNISLCAPRHLDSTLAWRPQGAVTLRQFLADAQALAARLPPASPWLLNVCQDRYHFAVGLVAGMLAGKTSLQPASQSAATLAQLARAYPGALCLHDAPFEAGEIPCLAYPETLAPSLEPVTAVPDFPAELTAVILFTSGSTGQPKPQAKTWGDLVLSAQAQAARLGQEHQPHAIVGTVPVQHSYGFESTLMLALQGGCSFWAGKPFYPQDIAAALAAVPEPRLLVTTPFHLSALLNAEIPLPPVQMLLSATAPLSKELAARAEARCAAPVLEIYGSTETGQLASRRTTEGDIWQLMPGARLEQRDDITLAYGRYIPEPLALGDIVELCGPDTFRLLGRNNDLINIAGKRTSLAYLNHQINSIPGVLDGAFYLPDEEKPDGISRLTAFVVAPDLSREALLAQLRQRLDPVFLPRPLHLLEALPRNSTGKLTREALLDLHRQCQPAR